MQRALRSLLLILAALTLHAAPVAAAEVTQFSPDGTVKRVRQVSAFFSEAMATSAESSPHLPRSDHHRHPRRHLRPPARSAR